MNKVNQRTATVNTILAVLKEDGIKYELNGETPISEVLKPAHKEKVRSVLFTMFREGEIEYKESFQANACYPTTITHPTRRTGYSIYPS